MTSIKEYEMDVDKATMKITLKNERVLDITLVGTSPYVNTRLALMGVLSLLRKRTDPEKAWEDIRLGHFDRVRTKSLGLTVRAMAIVGKIPAHEAFKLWQTMSKAERKEIKNDPSVQHTIVDLRAADKS